MRCEELMKRDVVSVSAEDTVQEAARLMREENVGFVPVCDAQHKVVGMLTDRDIVVRAVAEGLDVRTAKVSTLGHEVVDAFYVTDAEGRKLADPTHLREIELSVLDALTRPS